MADASATPSMEAAAAAQHGGGTVRVTGDAYIEVGTDLDDYSADAADTDTGTDLDALLVIQLAQLTTLLKNGDLTRDEWTAARAVTIASTLPGNQEIAPVSWGAMGGDDDDSSVASGCTSGTLETGGEASLHSQPDTDAESTTWQRPATTAADASAYSTNTETDSSICSASQPEAGNNTEPESNTEGESSSAYPNSTTCTSNTETETDAESSTYTDSADSTDTETESPGIGAPSEPRATSPTDEGRGPLALA